MSHDADALPRNISFFAFWDEETKVWVASSDEDRITTEGGTKEEIQEKLCLIVPDILHSRHAFNGSVTVSVNWQEPEAASRTEFVVE